jgi:exosortase/archaeosortase family protein
MRSLILFLAAGLAVAFLSARPMWQKITLSLAAIPIAVGSNVMRIVGEGLLDRYVSQRLSEGFYHAFVGIVLLVPGLLMFAVVGWILDRIVVRDKRVPGRNGQIAKEAVAKDPSSVTASHGRSVGGMYVTVVSVLAVAAGVFSVTASVLQLHFQKVPVALVKPLGDVPAELGRWRQVSVDRPIPADIQATLGTDHYIFRDYVDESLAGRQAVNDARSHPETEQAMVAALAALQPAAFVHASVTYYTGQVDSVSHVPEVCYVAGGISSAAHSEQARWIVAGRPLDVRLVRVDSDPSRGSSGARYVAYCFRVNGRDESENWKVRRSLMNVFERQAYYAKIEVMTPVADPKQAERVLNDFLSSAMPEIEKCLPSGASSEAGKP